MEQDIITLQDIFLFERLASRRRQGDGPVPGNWDPAQMCGTPRVAGVQLPMDMFDHVTR